MKSVNDWDTLMKDSPLPTLTIKQEVQRTVEVLRTATTRQVMRLAVPAITDSEQYVYRVLSELTDEKCIRTERVGRKSVRLAKGERKDQVLHRVGVSEVLVHMILAFDRLGYDWGLSAIAFDGVTPDAQVGFQKAGTWRVALIEYQRSPLSPKRWEKKLKRLRAGIVSMPEDVSDVYILFVVNAGKYYTDRYIRELSQRADHHAFYFTTVSRLLSVTDGYILTTPIWYHPFEQGLCSIFDPRRSSDVSA